MNVNVGTIDRALRIVAGLVLIPLAATNTVGWGGRLGGVPPAPRRAHNRLPKGGRPVQGHLHRHRRMVCIAQALTDAEQFDSSTLSRRRRPGHQSFSPRNPVGEIRPWASNPCIPPPSEALIGAADQLFPILEQLVCDWIVFL